MPIKVSIVEDHLDIRQALEAVLQLSPGYVLAGSYGSAEEAMSGIPIKPPDVVLMDIHLGGMDGISCVRLLKPLHPEVLFMMCTIYEDDEKIFEALRAGASGYVLKKTAPAKLLDAIQELYEGGAPMSSQIARKVVAAFQQPVAAPAPDGLAGSAAPGPNSQPPGEPTPLGDLTRRELEILQMLSKGMIYKEISSTLHISPETVRKHVYHIYEKLHVGNRVEAINKYFGR